MKNKILKIISFVLMQLFLLLDISRVGREEIIISKQTDCLSPRMQMNDLIFKKNFFEDIDISILNQRKDIKTPTVVAHRGGIYTGVKENTLKAFRNAIEIGAGAIELDLQMTKDKKIVVFHDERLGGKRISELMFEEVKNLKKEIPTIEEVIAIAKDKIELQLHIVWTYGNNAEFIKVLVELIKKRDIANQVIISSFYKGDIEKTNNLCPNLKTGLVVFPEDFPDIEEKLSALIKKASDLRVNYIMLPLRGTELPRAEIIKKLQNAGFYVEIGFRDIDEKTTEYVLDSGVDRITLDNPDILLNKIRENEFKQIFQAYSSIEKADKNGLLDKYVPYWRILKSMEQWGVHDNTVGEHTLGTLEALEWIKKEGFLNDVERPEDAYIYAFFHDFGKNPKFKYLPDIHNIEGAALARAVLLQLGFEVRQVQRFAWYIKHHHVLWWLAEKGSLQQNIKDEKIEEFLKKLTSTDINILTAVFLAEMMEIEGKSYEQLNKRNLRGILDVYKRLKIIAKAEDGQKEGKITEFIKYLEEIKIKDKPWNEKIKKEPSKNLHEDKWDISNLRKIQNEIICSKRTSPLLIETFLINQAI